MHEMGHLLGAHHTKWCGWSIPTFPFIGALDSCGNTEGGCAKGAPPPANGATIMSYCVTGGGAQFANFNNGFGIQPGDAVRNYVDLNSCIPGCILCTGLLNKTSDNNTLAVTNPHPHDKSLSTATSTFTDAAIPVKKENCFIPKINR
jgi:hypothetical protein